MRLKGLTNAEIGKKLGLHEITVSRLCSEVRKATAKTAIPETSEPDQKTILANWRDRLKTKSIRSVERALDDDTDAYKSGNIAVATLKGLGDFSGDTSVNVNLQAFIASIPDDMRDRYLSLDDVTEVKTNTVEEGGRYITSGGE